MNINKQTTGGWISGYIDKDGNHVIKHGTSDETPEGWEVPEATKNLPLDKNGFYHFPVNWGPVYENPLIVTHVSKKEIDNIKDDREGFKLISVNKETGQVVWKILD